jgi:heptosyltransferase-2
LWGIGDLVLATTLISAATRQYEVHLLAKPHARELLQPTFPDVVFHDFVAPWTAHRGKYRLWAWPWPTVLSLVWRLWRQKYSAAVSVRPDPRDHFLMWLAGARRRLGFPTKGSGTLLTDRLAARPEQHRVESWRVIGFALRLEGIDSSEPQLTADRYTTPRVDGALGERSRPLVCLHAGAAVSVRRWPEWHFEAIVRKLRDKFDFHLLLIPDFDGFGAKLSPLADTVLKSPSLRELIDVMSRADLVLCNDSGPMHIAAACGRSVIPFFGPGNPDWFRPWGAKHRMIIRDICPLRPCFDYCAFPENYCLTKLLPDDVWPEVEQHVRGLLASHVVTR